MRAGTTLFAQQLVLPAPIIIKTGVKEHTHAHVRRQENEASLACNAQKITTPSATQIYGMFIAAMQQHRSNSSAKCLGCAAAWAIDSNCGRRFIALVFYPGLLFSRDQEKQSVFLSRLRS